jgi:hypothetical protein
MVLVCVRVRVRVCVCVCFCHHQDLTPSLNQAGLRGATDGECFRLMRMYVGWLLMGSVFVTLRYTSFLVNSVSPVVSTEIWGVSPAPEKKG